MRPLLIATILLVQVAAAAPLSEQDACGDQYDAPNNAAYDIFNVTVEGVQGHDSVSVSLRADVIDCDAPYGYFVETLSDMMPVFNFTLNGTEMHPDVWVCASLPYACADAVVTEDDLGPDACVLENLTFEMRGTDVLGNTVVADRVPDEGSLTYDACWLFPVAEEECNLCNDTVDPVIEEEHEGVHEPDIEAPDEFLPLPMWLPLAVVAFATVARRRT